jgi:NADPH:quinone reductase-like Zn-dependent oxidoreductase
MATTMRAIVQETYGSADVLELRDIDQPTAGAGEVLLRVHAAGISRGDVHLMKGEPYLVRAAVGVRRPKNRVPGLDMAGTVVAIGPDVTRFSVGDEVFGIARGSFAQYAVAREDKLAHKPSVLTFAQAAAMPVSGLTALRALDAAGVHAGQTVLVVGASGGVGTYAVQLAVASGATVSGVASAAKTQLVRELGAADVIDYAHEDFADGSRTFDVVLDIGGMTPIARLRRALARTGTLVIVGGENGAVNPVGRDRVDGRRPGPPRAEAQPSGRRSAHRGVVRADPSPGAGPGRLHRRRRSGPARVHPDGDPVPDHPGLAAPPHRGQLARGRPLPRSRQRLTQQRTPRPDTPDSPIARRHGPCDRGDRRIDHLGQQRESRQRRLRL